MDASEEAKGQGPSATHGTQHRAKNDVRPSAQRGESVSAGDARVEKSEVPEIPDGSTAITRGRKPSHQHFRKLLAEAVSDEDFEKIVAKVVRCAKLGDPWAVQELFNRLMGKPVPGAVQQGPTKLAGVILMPQVEDPDAWAERHAATIEVDDVEVLEG